MTSREIDPGELRMRFYRQLPDEVRAVVERMVAEAAAGSGVYVAGGVVRDLLLDRTIGDVDVDLVTEADASIVARRMADEARVTVHERFRTATIEVGGYRIDLAMARRETYASPGALPDVAPADIRDDMARRDFTMNALALRLHDEAALIDPCEGRADIERRIVRVLGDDSFRDDATRIFRAFRYGARLDFTIEPRTRELIDDDVRFIETIGGERLRHEMHLLFDEPTGGIALEACDEAGALGAIHSALGWSARRTAAMRQRSSDIASRELGFALLASDATQEQAGAIVERLQLSRQEAAAVRGVASLRAAVELLRRRDVKPSGVATVLDRYPPPSIEAYAALTDDDSISDLMRRYLKEWRTERPMLTGHDLIEMGVPEGPQIKRGLQLIRAARLDGWATDRDDERALALRFAKSIRDSRAMNQPLDFKLYEN